MERPWLRHVALGRRVVVHRHHRRPPPAVRRLGGDRCQRRTTCRSHAISSPRSSPRRSSWATATSTTPATSGSWPAGPEPTIVGSEEICTVADEGARRRGPHPPRSPARSPARWPRRAPGTAQPLHLFADLPALTILQHVHSDTRPPGNGNQLDPFVPVFDPRPYIENPNTDPAELARFLGQQQRERPRRHVALPPADQRLHPGAR